MPVCCFSRMAEEVEETNNGVKKKGDWKEISEFAEDVEDALEDSGVEGDSVKKYNKWRPREEDDEKEVKKKTAKAASVEKNSLEEDSKGVKKDLGDASEKVAEIGEKVKEKQNPNPEIKEASRDVVKPFYSGFVKAFRKFERTVYSALMLRFNSYYFDTKDFSVDVKPEKDGEYRMDVKMSEEEKRQELQKKIEEKQV